MLDRASAPSQPGSHFDAGYLYVRDGRIFFLVCSRRSDLRQHFSPAIRALPLETPYPDHDSPPTYLEKRHSLAVVQQCRLCEKGPAEADTHNAIHTMELACLSLCFAHDSLVLGSIFFSPAIRALPLETDRRLSSRGRHTQRHPYLAASLPFLSDCSRRSDLKAACSSDTCSAPRN